MSATRSATVTDPHGLHARPAAEFVETARGFESALQILVADKKGNCKSLLSVLKMGITQGTVVTLEADGPDEEQAVEALAGLLEHASQDSTAP
jgi:phosphocarrier protein HPr